MLNEIKHVRQLKHEAKRRWFTSSEMDLMLWFNGRELIAWQFCYDKCQEEKGLSWKKDIGYRHFIVDDGEHGGALSHKSTPILSNAENVDQARILHLFESNSLRLPTDIRIKICTQIKELQ